MKKTALLLFGLNLLTINNCLFAQGSLTPPGAPGATMKTLTQIEPRTPISGAFNIAAPGSYYLTTNITLNLINQVGISINASGVTLDLNGFTIGSSANYSSVSNAGAIELGSGLSDITIRNGHLRGGVTYNSGTFSEFGFGDGINYSGTPPFNAHVTDVTVSGCLYNGINLGTSNLTFVDGCTVMTIGSYGIEAGSVSRSTAYLCGNNAITANIVTDCYGLALEGDGVSASQTANNCFGNAMDGFGISATTANNCYGVFRNVSGAGLSATIAIGCYGITPPRGGTGLSAYIAIGCYGFCQGSGDGIIATIANSCYSSTGDLAITHTYNMP
jgi:hypothetical protein